MAFQVRVLVVSAALVAGVVIAADLPDHIPLASAAPGGQNDAGSGQDAGDTPAQALLIPSGTRTFAGNLSPAGQDADWYRHSTSSAFCALADATLSTAGQLTIAADVHRAYSASRSVQPQTPLTLALAAPAGLTPYLGIEPGPSMTKEGGGSSPGRYSFKFQSFSMSDLDPDANGEVPEAGATSATAVALPGACSAGRLSSTDTTDRFYYDITEPREIWLSLAVASGDGNIQLTFVSPSGAAATTIPSGQSGEVYASETGRWNVVITRSSTSTPASSAATLPILGALSSSSDLSTTGTDYILALSEGPDPCRPSC